MKLNTLRKYYRIFRRYYHKLILNRKFKNLYLYSYTKINKLPKIPYKNNFFGYYNITPFNANGDVILCGTNNRTLPGKAFEDIKIILVKNKSNSIINISNSKSWNWQQGCMLQWFARNSSEIIYNTYSAIDNLFYSEILNISTKQKKRINSTIYSISSDGTFGFTLNFSRLAKYRPDYGYFNKNYNLPDENNSDGIYKIDIKNNNRYLFLSFNQIIAYKADITMEKAHHRVNHLDISPDNKNLIFLHRWVKDNNQYMRLLVTNCDNATLSLLHEDKMISHYSWINNFEIICFCSSKEIKNRYRIFNLKKIGHVVILHNLPHQDGHPSISPDKKWILTDTYPDKAGFSNIYIYHLATKRKILLLSAFQPLRYEGQLRCDLHPRWNLKGDKISFDSSHTGFRNMFTITLDTNKLIDEYINVKR